MFTGIIETLGIVTGITREQGNVHFHIKSAISPELKVDQSVSHNGVCLTVVAITGDEHKVTAIAESLFRSNLGNLKEGDAVNLERGMKIGDRLDGHIVQGHVDEKAICTAIEDRDGSWEFVFEYGAESKNVTIEKGSITVNGVSLTVVRSEPGLFSVAIIPFTMEHTNFNGIEVGTEVNIEFDVIGKYVAKLHT